MYILYDTFGYGSMESNTVGTGLDLSLRTFLFIGFFTPPLAGEVGRGLLVR